MSGAVLVLAVPALLTGAPLTGNRSIDMVLLLVVIALAIWPNPVTPLIAFALFIGARKLGQRQKENLA